MSAQELASKVDEKVKILQSATGADIRNAEDHYIQQNNALKGEVASLKRKLIGMELVAGYIQYSLPTLPTKVVCDKISATNDESVVHVPSNAHLAAAQSKSTEAKPGASSSAAPLKCCKKGGAPASASDQPIDISRIDMRVGKIVEVELHPDADTLYVEKVDLGEGHLRTVISGLVKFVPIEKMRGLTGIFMSNLKPMKMRGIESQGMLMCASNADHTHVEPLIIESPSSPPTVGDRVYVEAYPGEPDAFLNPKKKIWETVKPDFRVDASCVATYKGSPWKLLGDPSAVIKAPSISNAQIS